MSKSRRTNAARSSGKAKPSTTTALARIDRKLQKMTVQKAWEVLAPAPSTEAMTTRLADEAAVGTLGMHELQLTDKEESTLARAVNVFEVRMKPTGQPYLSHPSYTKWFNAAFGRLAWALVPAAKPVRTDKGVAQAFKFFVHGKAVAFATGEQDYHENNDQQTWGDALEACFASALRRVAKRIGVGLELWDKEWLDAYISEHCVYVDTAKGKLWRRKVDKPFWNEIGAPKPRVEKPAAPIEARGETRTVPQQPTMPGGVGEQLITKGTKQQPGQLERLWSIIRNSGRNEETVRTWLLHVYGIDSTQKIQRKHYDEICKAIASKKELL